MIGNIVIPVRLPEWIRTVTTEDLHLLWKKAAEFSVANAPAETTHFGASPHRIRVSAEPAIGVCNAEKSKIAVELLHIAADFHPNQDFALAWCDSGAYPGANKLRTDFPEGQTIRYLYIKRHNVGRDRWLVTHGQKENLPLAVARARTLAIRLHQALIEAFPPPPQEPSPIVM